MTKSKRQYRRLGRLTYENRRLYKIWHGMHQRCSNPSLVIYKYYGARGLTVSPEWKDFAPFLEWSLANGYADGLTIDRKDNTKGYSPDNCRWATDKQQSRNKTNSVRFPFEGKDLTVPEISEITGVPANAIKLRLANGWDFEVAVRTPSKPKDPHISARGQTMRTTEWAKTLGIPQARIAERLRKGWPADEALGFTERPGRWGER